MNILYIDHYAGSLDYGMEFRPYYLSREWVKLGHKVRIISASYSHLRIKNPDVIKDFDKEVIDGIEYQWIKTISYDKNGVKRAITMFQFCWKLWNNAKKSVDDFHPDIVITSSTYPLDTYAGQKIAKIAKAKLIHEGHDLWPLTLTEIGGMSEYHPFVLLMGMAEKSAYEHSNEVVSVLPFSYKYMVKHGLDDIKKFHYIPNGIVEEDWNLNLVLPQFYSKFFNDVHVRFPFIISYIGGHAPSNKLEILIDVAYKMKNSKVAFVLIGRGIEKEKLITKAQKIGCNNVFFLPPVDKKLVPAILKNADALYIGAEKTPLFDYGVSANKVCDYMMSGKPILYAVEAANNEVAEAKCGITLEAGDVSSIINGIKKLINMSKHDINQLGFNGQQWVLENREYKRLAGQFNKVFNS